MILNHTDAQTQGTIRLIYGDKEVSSKSFREGDKDLLTFLWNRGDNQQVSVDEHTLELYHNEVMILNANQTFHASSPEDLVIWRFNRDFYCIIDHDAEVSCAGLLFYGHRSIPKIKLSQEDYRRLDLLFNVFLDEFSEPDDNLKTEMLRVILKRLIVKLTRIYKRQTELTHLEDNELDLIRRFNLLVEINYKELHQVQDYADLLHKSSKTISNLFTKYSEHSPLEVIHNRLILEAKRLLLYTDKSAKEIAYDLGFSDIPNFSRFFKKNMSLSPTQYREENRKVVV